MKKFILSVLRIAGGVLLVLFMLWIYAVYTHAPHTMEKGTRCKSSIIVLDALVRDYKAYPYADTLEEIAMARDAAERVCVYDSKWPERDQKAINDVVGHLLDL